jgi:hypothetical protein
MIATGPALARVYMRNKQRHTKQKCLTVMAEKTNGERPRAAQSIT